jgi:glycosyltransferase involved in cell wall biosynthesis
MTDDVDVTVVLPVFNEAGHVLTEIDRITAALDASPYTYEIIVVDDGSTDGSTEQLVGVEAIRLIRLPENRGSGTARRIGSRAARGRAVVWTDADLTYPNDRIPELVKELAGHDQVVGARTSEQGTAKLARVPTKWFIRKLASFLVERPIPDLNSGLRVFRADVGRQFLHMLPAGFSCVTTMTMTFLANGYSVKYVPIEYSTRAGRSKFHWWLDTKRYVIQVVRMVMTYNPLRVFLPTAMSLALVGGTKLVYDIATKDWRPALNTLLILFAALQLLAIGLLADLVVRVTRPSDQVDPAVDAHPSQI